MENKNFDDDNQAALFDLTLYDSSNLVEPIKLLPPQRTIWTENKANLIENYIQLFVYVTKHGTYIDGFAGPQEPDKPEMWAANLVLKSQPCRMNKFYLFDAVKTQYKALKQLKDEWDARTLTDNQGRKVYRKIQVERGDFNKLIHKLLSSKVIGQREATFCLLDQRTFECEWSTVQALAKYREPGYRKIELFYFLPNSWQDRALAALKRNPHKAQLWWGRDDWEQLREMGSFQRQQIFCERFRDELGYKYVNPHPIYQREKGGGQVMYYMIHATDHEEAPVLMRRAYNKAVCVPPPDQRDLPFNGSPSSNSPANRRRAPGYKPIGRINASPSL
ncbi:MAG TPA: three-Cys-motif partner protein TcmP [Pyrinomonadaceae bacterium]|nr:three-Cys-motif partner protein TcmP [Pyrinomonadaceae bacterium]